MAISSRDRAKDETKLSGVQVFRSLDLKAAKCAMVCSGHLASGHKAGPCANSTVLWLAHVLRICWLTRKASN